MNDTDNLPPYKRPGFDFAKANEELRIATGHLKELVRLIEELENQDSEKDDE